MAYLQDRSATYKTKLHEFQKILKTIQPMSLTSQTFGREMNALTIAIPHSEIKYDLTGSTLAFTCDPENSYIMLDS